MTSRTLAAAALAAAVVSAQALSTQALARGPAPLVPTALVEDVTSATAGVEFMDYVGPGQVIELKPRDVLVLSYLKSCAHETITGGTVAIGAEQSEVTGGKISRSKVPCDGGKMKLTSQQASASGASAFRLQSADGEPTLYALPPMIQVPKVLMSDSRTLVIQRLDRPGQRVEVKIDQDLAPGSFYDLAKTDMEPLARGGKYSASLGGRSITFTVDAKAKMVAKFGNKSGKVPVISRLLRFTPG